MKISRGAAKGLEYLHESASQPVIYRDFKASNILLDKDFSAKLSDFGLAKLGSPGPVNHRVEQANAVAGDRLNKEEERIHYAGNWPTWTHLVNMITCKM
ncbi:hypothetical protein LWI29_007386 [Acer saccharum]|uniref:Protein kinase domain-containing protein n=1 Tax=Acer saccharum TaxID=4024 RepID=A0AA39SUS8_ACESA|nr:hypothetical protein LWI29_007386 [Acer saccharum]